MKIAEFLKDDFFIFPKKQSDKEDYKVFVTKMLNKFIGKLEKIENFEEIRFSMSSIIERQKHLVTQLKLTLDYYYSGKPADALHELSKGLKSNIKDFGELLNIRKFGSQEDFYRVRISKENFPLPARNFFHIPFDLRGKVKTQRFSIPGFPSLYLGTTIYVCWEELNRPNLNDFQAVRLRNSQNIKLVDLAPPLMDEATPYDLYRFLMIWPLVFTCSICVRNYSDDFKPEYIISQLLLQWVRENSLIDGISYQTTHIDFANTLSKGEFINIVLPVKENKTKGLCADLKSKFIMTEATSFQLNQCATNALIDGGGGEQFKHKIDRLELIKGLPSDYAVSVFGELEEVLDKMETKEI